MISVDEALAQLFALAQPLGTEEVPLREAAGRVLREDAVARRDQPPFAGSAMDGYALIAEEAVVGASFEVIGESAAGHRFDGTVSAGQAVRIFTGAPIPDGATRVVLQEDVTREGDRITLGERLDTGPHIRAAGIDFRAGDRLTAPRLLRPADVALLAAMNAPRLTVSRRPEVALISTGDELVLPGEDPGPDQIIASNTFGLEALFRAHGATVRLLPLARDSRASLEATFALASGADLVVTIGGASVGDHDLVGRVAADLGMEQSFYKVAMRPGKPLMAGRMGAEMGGAMMIGLPGNPVSAMVCGHVFVAPVLRALQGLPPAPAPLARAPLLEDLPANGPRAHYMRALLSPEGLRPAGSQDSSLLSLLSEAGALIMRPPEAPAARAGEILPYLPL
ncbi:molybdopterin molybdochelatase [Pseudooceanicola antarcticus]|uniref:Molybdopterin molybdenumtransferase n=1 Tax=Pseudooceanicola antarcticus TaxID=1247613 RepID=A0A285J6H3_9RHOB|nr:gephyrin-like molybdotransferase Glp [Pseudooceanicola antarcticus]PJE26887.1 molybdopterin molybdenumtransferase MoeA [Pseudooceanicola antarcticus]SNY55663.1 molybdopterin molybdochelatase [Pseudooceanicola antarcticus]